MLFDNMDFLFFSISSCCFLVGIGTLVGYITLCFLNGDMIIIPEFSINAFLIGCIFLILSLFIFGLNKLCEKPLKNR